MDSLVVGCCRWSWTRRARLQRIDSNIVGSGRVLYVSWNGRAIGRVGE